MNSPYPETALETIRRLALDADSFAFLSIDHRGILIEKGGELTTLDLPDWEIGDNILDKALFLHGYLPLATEQESIVSYQLSDSCVIDIHLFDDEDRVLVLLIDRSVDSREDTEIRQRRNEARLRERYARRRDEED